MKHFHSRRLCTACHRGLPRAAQRCPWCRSPFDDVPPVDMPAQPVLRTGHGPGQRREAR